MNVKQTELVMWDWNGTLHDDAQAAHQSVNDMLVRRGMPTITFEQYSSYIDTPIIGFYRHIFDLEKITFDIIAEEFSAGFDLHMKGRGLMPGAEAALAALKGAGIRQIVLSSSEKGVLNRYVESYGISDSFEAILGSDDFEAGGKTDRARAYIAKCGISPERAVVVGDIIHDSEVARQIGSRCVLVARGHQTRRDLEPSGVPVADDISEAVEFILGR